MAGTKHTALPWTFSPWHIEEGPSAVRAPQGHVVCCTASDDDAEYISIACNAYPDLVKALKAIIAEPYGCVFCDSGKLRNPNKPHEPDCGFMLAEQAIAKAEASHA